MRNGSLRREVRHLTGPLVCGPTSIMRAIARVVEPTFQSGTSKGKSICKARPKQIA